MKEFRDRFCKMCGKYREDKGFVPVRKNGRIYYYKCPICEAKKEKK